MKNVFFLHPLAIPFYRCRSSWFPIHHSQTKEAKEAGVRNVPLERYLRSFLDLSVNLYLECILKKVGRNSKRSLHFSDGTAKGIQGKGIQCLQKLIVITRSIIISRKSQIPNDRCAMSRGSYGCRVGRKKPVLPNDGATFAVKPTGF